MKQLKIIINAKRKKALQIWIKIYLGILIPSKAVKKGNSSPLDFLAAVLFEEHPNIIGHANRNGGKTLIFAILDLLNSLARDNCETTTAGAIEAQAKRCYRYFQKFCNTIKFTNDMLVSSLMGETKFTNGSLVEIITATMSGVNSPHPNKSFIDEVDLMDWSILQEALSMAKSDPNIMGQNILASTQKTPTGPMAKLLRSANDIGFKTYTWSIYEVIEPHHKSEVEGTALYEDLKPYYDKDGNYPSDGFYSVQDAISKKETLDPGIWEAQWLCDKPEKKGLIYPQYSEKNKRKWDYNPKYEFYIGEDFGFGENHPNVVLFYQIIDWQKPEIQIFDSIYLTESITQDIIEAVVKRLKEEHGITINQLHGVYRFREYIQGWIPDPAGLSEISERKQLGCPILEKASESALYKVTNGFPIIRRFLRNANLYIDTDRCPQLDDELQLYRYKKMPNGEYTDVPEKSNDHGPDNIRYFSVRLFPKLALQTLGITIDNEDDEDDFVTANLMDKVL